MNTRIKGLVVLGALLLALLVQAVPAFADGVAPTPTLGQVAAARHCDGCHGVGMTLPPR